MSTENNLDKLYNDSIDLMIEMIENPKKDFRSRISKLWI